jgi:biotin--protein ligase
LKSGTVILTNCQTAGRGRGLNGWISQMGCLQFSMRLIHNHMNSVIFIQYLFGLAVCEAITNMQGCNQLDICLKWPNDIYAKHKGNLYKIGGVLLTSEVINKTFTITIGIFYLF